MQKLKDITVLVTACGAQFMPGLVSCLKRNGERRIRVIGTDMQGDATVLQMIDVYYKVPHVADVSYTDVLLDICKKEKVDVLLPFMSSELLLLIDRKYEFERIGVKISVSDRRSVEITNNKFRLYTFLKESGFSVPRFARIARADEFADACKACGYPQNAVCVKATELSGSRGIRIISPDISRFDILFGEKPNSFYTTMDEMLATLHERDSMPEMMAMEYLPGDEGSVDLLADHGEILYMAYRESNLNLHSIPQIATLRKNEEAYFIAEKVTAALGMHGNADLDFKNDAQGHPVLMEINPRIAATMQIFAVGGLNLPYLRIKQLLKEKLPEVEVNYGVKMTRRYLEMFTSSEITENGEGTYS